MRTQFPVILSGMVVLVVWAIPSLAEEKIQAVVTSSGRLVFTNLVDIARAPPPEVITESTDVLAAEMPQVLRSMVDVIAHNHRVAPALVRAVLNTEANFNR